MLDIKLPPDVEAHFDELARRTGRSASDYAREAILEKIEEIEDRLLADERHRTDSGERVPLSDILSRYAGDIDAKE